MNPQKPIRVKDHLAEKLKDPQFKESYAVELFKMEIAEIVIKERMKRKLTQGQLADKIKVTQQAISKIENGEFTSIKTVMRVLMALHCRATVALPAREVPL